ncbi:MAG: 50S ribosomal protein L7/L12 [Bacilli bacterium]|nr:50S ribosomal protein L7/L12 [Bacilli bacterium]
MDTQKFLEDLKGMTVLELNELVKAIEEEFGVTAAAMVAAGPVAAGEEKEEGPALVSVILKSAAANKVGIIKAVKDLLGLSLMDAKKLVETPDAKIKENVSKEEAEAVAAKLKEVQAEVEVK